MKMFIHLKCIDIMYNLIKFCNVPGVIVFIYFINSKIYIYYIFTLYTFLYFYVLYLSFKNLYVIYRFIHNYKYVI